MGPGQLKESEARREEKGSRHIGKSQIPVERHSRDVLGRDAKCHGYDGLIRVKILASWGKSLGEHTILKNEAFFGGDLHNLCEMSLSKLS